MHLRNPISHDRIEYSEQDADAQLLYINFLVNQIDNSSGRQLITDWLEYLQSDSFTSSKVFAQELIKELPKKQQYDLLVSIWRERSSFKQNSINFFVDELVDRITSQEKSSFVNIMNSELINCSGDRDLSMMFHFFAKNFYNGLKKVVKIHVEDIVKKGIANGVCIDSKSRGDYAATATWATEYIDLFITKNDIIKIIRNRFLNSEESSQYIQKFFGKYVNLEDPETLDVLKDAIKMHLRRGDNYVYEIIMSYKYDCYCADTIWEESNIYNEFSKEIELCKKKLDESPKEPEIYDDMPF